MTDEYIRRKDAVKIAEKYGLTNGSVLGRHTGLAYWTGRLHCKRDCNFVSRRCYSGGACAVGTY